MTWIKMIRDRRGSSVALKAHDSTERATNALLAPSPKRLQGDVEPVQILRAAPRRTHRFDDQALPLGLGDRAQEDVSATDLRDVAGGVQAVDDVDQDDQ